VHSFRHNAIPGYGQTDTRSQKYGVPGSVKSFSIKPHTCRVCSISVPVRLVGGSSSREGRLEVYFMGVWGTVCDDGFTDAAARVACYMLGYG